MKFDRPKFRIYLDITLFLIISIVCIFYMAIGVITDDHIIQPVSFFMLVYLINLTYYRICMELGGIIKKPHKISVIDFLSILFILCFMCSVLLVIYLAYFALQELLHMTLKEILSNHIFYASVVGSAFVIHLAFDNTTTLYNLYFKRHE